MPVYKSIQLVGTSEKKT